MEEKEGLLEEIMQQMQRKYMQFIEIEKLTKELGDTLSRGDRESVQLLLEMRQDEMNKADSTQKDIETILSAVDSDTASEIRGWLDEKKELSADEDGFEAKKIKELSVQTRKSLERTISIDRIISQKLAGKDSYYSE